MCFTHSYDVDDHIPEDLTGKVIIVTGANSGLGYETTRKLSSKGATVILGCRNEAKANEAMDKTKSEHEKADLLFIPLDLSKLSSIKTFVERFTAQYNNLDVLICNAGVDKGPSGNRSLREETEDGFEYVAGVNYFATYALTIRLLNAGVLDHGSAPARIVICSSLAHLPFMAGKINLDTLDDIDYKERKYGFPMNYGQSKGFCQLFAAKLQRELDERVAAHGKILVITTHPGLVTTNLNNDYAFVRAIGMHPERGSAVFVVAAVSNRQDIQPGMLLGVNDCLRTFGTPAPMQPAKYTFDTTLQDKLWDITATRTSLRLE